MPQAIDPESQQKLAENAAEVAVLEAGRTVLSDELKKAAEELERARIDALDGKDVPGPGAEDPPIPARSDREAGHSRELERLGSRIDRLKAEFAKVHSDWKQKHEEGVELDSFLRRPR